LSDKQILELFVLQGDASKENAVLTDPIIKPTEIKWFLPKSFSFPFEGSQRRFGNAWSIYVN